MSQAAGSGVVQPVVRRQDVPSVFLAALKKRFGPQFSTGQALCEQHGRDESPYSVPPPAAVVFAQTLADVVDVTRLCAQHRVPLIPFGVGSSLEGQLLAVRGGISLDMSRMNRVLAFNDKDLTATVQPGVTREQLNEQLRGTGFFFPVDPGANATLGGMASTCDSGTNAVRYGTMRENVLALQVVTADGAVIRTGSSSSKPGAGYDLTALFVGSEGTLGVMTEITLRIHPLPAAVSAALCSFPSVADAVNTVIKTIQTDVPIARVELLGASTVRMVNRYSKLSLREQPLLMMEFHGSPASVRDQAAIVQEIAGRNRGADFEWAERPEDRTRLWTARHNAHFAVVASRPGCRSVTTDVCVPISRLADAILGAVADADASGIPYSLLGHVGDGNFHMGYLIDPDDEQERQRAEELNHRQVMRALRLGGTCTGEHGVGLHKMGFLEQEAGPGAIDMMRSIKRTLDLAGIFNPGKIFAL